MKTKSKLKLKKVIGQLKQKLKNKSVRKLHSRPSPIWPVMCLVDVKPWSANQIPALCIYTCLSQEAAATADGVCEICACWTVTGAWHGRIVGSTVMLLLLIASLHFAVPGMVAVCDWSELLHDELHWLDVPQRVDYKLCATVHCCLQHKAPPYLVDLCTPVSDIASRQHLRSASSNQLVVPRHHRTQFGLWAFSVAGPMAWNVLPDSIRDTALSTCSFRRYLKTLLFSFY